MRETNPPAGRACTPVSTVLDHLHAEGVTHLFGVPGGPLTPVYDALYDDARFTLVTTRHEAGAAFMAAGYAAATGRLGVCLATTGPGTTNLVTGLAAAFSDSLPVLALTANVPALAFGKGSLQDSTDDRIDTVAMLRACTKASTMLADPRNTGSTLRRLLRAAMSGRRGPVHLNIPTDLMRRTVVLDLERPERYRGMPRPFDREAVKEAASALLAARRPAILAGSGVRLAGAEPELRELVRLLGAPAATTPKGKGVVSEMDPLALGVFGIASSPLAEAYLLDGGVDALLVLGSSLHEISTQGWDERLAPSGPLIQADIDPRVLGRNYRVDIALVGHLKTTLRELLFELRRRTASGEFPEPAGAGDFLEWRGGRSAFLDPGARVSDAVPLKPQRLMAELEGCLPEDALVFMDSGNNTLWTLHHLRASGRSRFIHNWGEFGAMGFGVAAAIGAKAVLPDRPVVAVVGDGSMGMAGMELLTASTFEIPVVWVVLNDARYNTVHHGQTMQYAGRTIGTTFRRMDLAALAESLGVDGHYVDLPEEVAPAMRAALRSGRASLLDVRIDADEVPPVHSRIRALDRFFMEKAF